MRTERQIMDDIGEVYMDLQPENLEEDGELAPSKVKQKKSRLEGLLKTLFRELGREVTEDEIFEYLERNP